MQELEKILEEMQSIKEIMLSPTNIDCFGEPCKENDCCACVVNKCMEIMRKHMNDGWISVEEKPKKDYIAVLAVDKHDYYFVAVYDKEHGFRSNDIGADIDNIVAYCLFYPYCPERSDNHDGEGSNKNI